MRITSVVALALASIPITPAIAGHYHEETQEEKQQDELVRQADASPHAQYGIGPRFGSYHVGPIYDLGFGITFEGGVRLDRLALLGEYTLLGITSAQTMNRSSSDTAAAGATTPASPAPDYPGGLVQRLGVNARYSVAKFFEAAAGTGARGDLFVESGFGEQLVRWSGGGYLHRADISLGVGFGIQFRGPHHHGGYQIGARVTLAAPPAAYEMQASAPTCAGPCDSPTGKMNIDRSVLGGLTVVFGD